MRLMKRVLIALLILAPPSSVCAADSDTGRYQLQIARDGKVLVLLDTATGQNWIADAPERVSDGGEHHRTFWIENAFLRWDKSAKLHKPAALPPPPTPE